MMHDSTKEVDLTRFTFGGRSSDSSAVPSTVARTEETAELLDRFRDSLVISENAKKFAIARELERIKSGLLVIETVIPTVLVLSAFYFLGVIEREVKILKGGPPRVRMAFYMVWAGATFFVTQHLLDNARRDGEAKFDLRASKLGKEYAEGGVEFYDKKLQRNIALRYLAPVDKGKKFYNLKGEFNEYWFRKKYVPLEERRKICQNVLNEA